MSQRTSVASVVALYKMRIDALVETAPPNICVRAVMSRVFSRILTVCKLEFLSGNIGTAKYSSFLDLVLKPFVRSEQKYIERIPPSHSQGLQSK